MTNKIGIGVEATFDTRAVEQGAKKVEEALNQVGKTQINPVSDKALKQLDALNQKFQQLLKVDGELRRRIKATGQSGALFENIDWGATHPDAGARARKLNSINSYLGVGSPGHSSIPPPPAPPGPPPRQPVRGGFAGGAVNVVQAGLRSAGPAGSVAAGALGSGMQAGAGGGFASGLGAAAGGLLGGLLALGVSKIVGGIMEKVGQAEDNNVAYDRLKRTIGDVGVSFQGLKAVVTAGAENLRITYGEFGALGTQFAKAGNMSAGQYGTLGGEVGIGLGISRSYGLDPSQGVGLMGQMRGLGITKDTQDSRKFALLIGETIGKSGAFAKAEEVFDAIGGYASTQTRSGMGAANVGGYAGMFSAMVGSGIPGLDPSGAGGMLSRINSVLSAGGAKGEASQFFTAMVGKGMGLDPIQTQILREGGAFATNDEAFGPGSAAARFGISGPSGSTTFLQGSMSELRKQYGGDKGMLAQATANHLGVNMRQAMALLSVNPNQMGEMQGYAGDLTKLNAGGIGNLSKVLYGSGADRQSVANSLLGRDDVSGRDKADLSGDAFVKGDAETQKRILANIVSRYDQERTTGSDIRDSKNALDNIKTALADKLVPLAMEMRHGIMAIAGAGKGKSSEEIMREVVEADSAGRVKGINGRFTPEANALRERQGDLENRRRSLDPVALARTYADKPEILEQKLKERGMVEAELSTIGKRLAELEAEKAALLKKENERKAKELSDVHDGIEARWAIEDMGAGGGGAGGRPGGGGGGGGGSGGKIGPLDANKRNAAMKFFMSKGWTKEQAAGIVANLGAESALNEGVTGDGGLAYGLAQWHPDRQADFEKKFGKSIKGSSFMEQLEFANHELTEGRYKRAGNLIKQSTSAGQSAEYGSRYWEIPRDANGQAAARAAAADRIAATPLPDGLGAGAGRGEDPRKFMVTAEPIVVRHENAKGQQVQPPQTLQTRVAPATPFGRGH